MKRILFFLITLISFIEGYGQTSFTADILFARRSIFIRDRYVDSVQNDTAFMNRVRSVPTSDAVRRFVEGRLAGISGITGTVDPDELAIGAAGNTLTSKDDFKFVESTKYLLNARYLRSEFLAFQSNSVPVGNTNYFIVQPAISDDVDSTTRLLFGPASYSGGTYLFSKFSFYLDRFGNTIFGAEGITGNGLAKYHSNRRSSFDNLTLVDKGYVDSLISTVGGGPETDPVFNANGVKITGAQDIAGVKTFTDNPEVKGDGSTSAAVNFKDGVTTKAAVGWNETNDRVELSGLKPVALFNLEGGASIPQIIANDTVLNANVPLEMAQRALRITGLEPGLIEYDGTHFYGTVNGGGRHQLDADIKAVQALADGATITWNIASGYNATVTLAGNRTLAINNATAGCYGTLKIVQDATGSRTITLPAGSKVISGGTGAVTLTTTASAIDILTFFYDGTNFFWTVGKNFN
jgi:hypothetical protein